MASTDVLGNIYKFEQPTIKIESSEEDNAVEIGVDDIFDSSDKGNISDSDINSLSPFVETEDPQQENDVDITVNELFKSSYEKGIPYFGKQEPKDRKTVPLEKVSNLLEKKYEGGGDKVLDKQPKEVELENGDSKIEEVVKDFNEADNLRSEEQLIINFNKNVDNDVTQSEDCVVPDEINWADTFKTYHKTDCQEELKKVIFIAAPSATAVIKPHEYTKLGPYEHICNHCHHIYKDMRLLKAHIRKKHRDITNMYECPYCPHKSKSYLGSHIISKHMDEKDIKWFRCHTCDMKFKFKAKLTRHMLTHLGPAPLGKSLQQCTMCSKTFNTADTLRSHIKGVHNKMRRKEIKCQQCDYICVDNNNMKKHIEVYHTSSDQRRTYECEQCDHKTTFEYKFKQHKKTHAKQYCCENCAFVTSNLQHFKLHQITHETTVDESILKYRCDKCDYKTYRCYSLSVHKLNHLKQDEINYFYCYHCDFKAKRKDNLKTHVLKHFKRGEINFHCFKCDFSTKERTLLSDHLRQNHSKKQRQLL